MRIWLCPEPDTPCQKWQAGEDHLVHATNEALATQKYTKGTKPLILIENSLLLIEGKEEEKAEFYRHFLVFGVKFF